MRTRLIRVAVSLLVAGVTSLVGAQDPEVPTNPNIPMVDAVAAQKPARYIVQFRQEPVVKLTAKSSRDRLARQAGILDEQEQFAQELLTMRGVTNRPKGPAAPTLFPFQYSLVLNGVAVELTPDEVAQTSLLPYVLSVDADRPVQAILSDSVPQIGADVVRSTYGGTGAGILVSVIDTGIDYNHPALGGGIGPTFKVVGGYDFVNNDSDPMDDHYHGTHCAGIVAADGTVKGVAPSANLLAVKVLSASGSGWSSQTIAGIEYSLNPDGNVGTNDGAQVISMSLGSFSGAPNDPSSVATNNAVAAGAICVAGAGNEGPGYDTLLSPGTAVGAITVGAVSKTDAIASFSSRGPVREFWVSKPNIVAPGVSINSTNLGTTYIQRSGTSMATPHVAGAAAILKQLHPSWTVADVRSALIGTSVDLGLDLATQGAGRVDVLKATEAEIVFATTPLDLGKFTSLTYTGNHTVTIKNVGSSTHLVALSVDGAFLPLGATATITPASVSLAPGESTNATLALSASSAVNGPSVAPYLFNGFVKATYGSKSIRNPFTFYKEPPDTLEPNNTSVQARTITVSEIRTQVKGDGQTRIDPTQPGASSPDQDWYRFTGQAGRTFFALAMCASVGSSMETPELRLYNSSLVQIPGFVVPGITFVDSRVVYVTLPTTGTYYLKVGNGASYAPTGLYNLYVNYLPQAVDYMDRPVADYPEAGTFFGHHAIRQVALGGGGNAGYASAIMMTLNHYNTGATPSLTYRSMEDARPIFLDAARDGATAASVLYPTFSDATYSYNGTTWTLKNPATKPPRLYFPAMCYDPVRDKTIMFGGALLGGTQSEADGSGSTWSWDGTTWTMLNPATNPAPRRDHKMVWDSDRQVIVMFGSVFDGETWEWNGTDWTQKATGPSMTQFDMVYDPVRQEIIVHGNPWSFGAPETWRYKSDTWTQLTPTTMPPKTSYDMVWDPAGNRILNLVGFPQVTWSWDGTNWTQLASPWLTLGHIEFAYDSARSKIVLVTQPNANNPSIQFNYTYEWNGTGWTQISTPNAMPQTGAFALTYDSLRSETLFFGGHYVFNGENILNIVQTPTQTPVFSERMYYPNSITGLAVSADGTKVLTSHGHGNVEVRNQAGVLQRTIDRASAIILASMSEDGNVAVFKEGTSMRIIDLSTDTERTGYATDATVTALSDDGARIVYGKNGVVRLYQWNGSSYAMSWERTLPTAYNDAVGSADIAGDGSLIVVLGRKSISSTDSSQINHYLINAVDGEIVNSMMQVKNPQSEAKFMPLDVRVNADGSLAATMVSGGDKQYPEILGWNPKYSSPVYQLPLDGSGVSIDVLGQKILAGTVSTSSIPSEIGSLGYQGRVFLTDLTGVDTGKLSSYLTGMPTYHRTNDLWATYTAFDLNGNGVDEVKVHFRRDGGSLTEYATPFTTSPALLDVPTLGGEGTYEMYTIAKDGVGSFESAPSVPDATVIVDLTAPSVTTTTDQGTYRNNTALTFNWTVATDSGPSGLDGYDFQLSSDPAFSSVIAAGSQSTLSLNYTGVSGSFYHVRSRSKDKAGNTSAWSATDGILVDTEIPASSADALPPTHPSGTSFTVSWTATDPVASGTASDVANTRVYWRRNSGVYQLLGTYGVGTTSVSFDPSTHGGNGTYSFYTIATDNAGNVETAPATADAQTNVSPTGINDWNRLVEG